MTVPDAPRVSDVLAEALASTELKGAVERRTDGIPLLGRLSSIGRRVIARNTATALGKALDVDLLTVAERAWKTHDRLVAAGYRTAVGGAPEHVEIGQHVITSTHEPMVDVLVAEECALTVHFELVLKLTVAYLLADVRDGLLVALDPGPCRLAATLACEGVPVPPTGRATFRLGGRIDLVGGLPLVPSSFLPTSPAARTKVTEPATQVLQPPHLS